MNKTFAKALFTMALSTAGLLTLVGCHAPSSAAPAETGPASPTAGSASPSANDPTTASSSPTSAKPTAGASTKPASGTSSKPTSGSSSKPSQSGAFTAADFPAASKLGYYTTGDLQRLKVQPADFGHTLSCPAFASDLAYPDARKPVLMAFHSGPNGSWNGGEAPGDVMLGGAYADADHAKQGWEYTREKLRACADPGTGVTMGKINITHRGTYNAFYVDYTVKDSDEAGNAQTTRYSMGVVQSGNKLVIWAVPMTKDAWTTTPGQRLTHPMIKNLPVIAETLG